METRTLQMPQQADNYEGIRWPNPTPESRAREEASYQKLRRSMERNGVTADDILTDISRLDAAKKSAH